MPSLTAVGTCSSCSDTARVRAAVWSSGLPPPDSLLGASKSRRARALIMSSRANAARSWPLVMDDAGRRMIVDRVSPLRWAVIPAAAAAGTGITRPPSSTNGGGTTPKSYPIRHSLTLPPDHQACHGGLDRQPLRPPQPPDLRPVLHAQHLPMLHKTVPIRPEITWSVFRRSRQRAAARRHPADHPPREAQQQTLVNGSAASEA